MDPNMKASNPLAYLVFQIALRFLPNQTVSWFSLFKDEVNGKDPNFACPRRYDAVVQPFRSLVGDASLHNEFRQHAAELCGLQEPPAVPKKRRLVLLRRTRHMRSWGDVEELLQGLLAWAKRNDWQVEVLTLGWWVGIYFGTSFCLMFQFNLQYPSVKNLIPPTTFQFREVTWSHVSKLQPSKMHRLLSLCTARSITWPQRFCRKKQFYWC
jgi:hypothetical protein